jgi:hypothetical protein
VKSVKKTKEKSTRGNASQFFVAGELCRRGFCAVVTLGNTPNTDILCSNVEGTKFVHIQVETFVPGGRTCSVGMKAAKGFGENFFWVIAGIPTKDMNKPFDYYIIPSLIMAKHVSEGHDLWLKTSGKKGEKHNENKVRTVHIPPYKSFNGWDISEYRNNWKLIDEKLG